MFACGYRDLQGLAGPIRWSWSRPVSRSATRRRAHLVTAFQAALKQNVLTPDIGGTASTADMTRAVIRNIGLLADDFTRHP
jgi:isocitrate/isopropylmalate dehydrogenase